MYDMQFQVAPMQSPLTGGIDQQTILQTIESGAGSPPSYNITSEDIGESWAGGVIFTISGSDENTVKNGLAKAISGISNRTTFTDVGIPIPPPTVTDSIKKDLSAVNPFPLLGEGLQKFLDSLKSFLTPVLIMVVLIIAALAYMKTTRTA